MEVVIGVEVVEVQVGVGVLFGMGLFLCLMGLLLPLELLNLVGKGGRFLLLGLPCLVGLQVLLLLQFVSGLHLQPSSLGFHQVLASGLNLVLNILHLVIDPMKEGVGVGLHMSYEILLIEDSGHTSNIY